ncbi:MAG: hypothetical protein HYR63_11990 [Proteobacteria bacterium]|nr:hypothetical protein [Pseudomonadota bacterium]MBI3498517.1 hypothetical protein [Pseudomonadota bacterium]
MQIQITVDDTRFGCMGFTCEEIIALIRGMLLEGSYDFGDRYCSSLAVSIAPQDVDDGSRQPGGQSKLRLVIG